MRNYTPLCSRAPFRCATRLLAIAAVFVTFTFGTTPTLAATPGVIGMSRVAPSPVAGVTTNEETGSLESAAAKAGETGRKIAMSLIALGFAIASIVLAFKRDFKEAAGIFAVGLIAILLATPAGVNVLHSTVNSLFGAS